jgi:putative redox protein
MATSKVIYKGDKITEAEHLSSGTKIITDAPVDNHGKGSAFSPSDLIATSLASCMFTVLGIASGEHGFSIDGASATVTKIMVSDPRRVGGIQVEMHFPPNNYSDKQKELIRRIALTCPVAKSLHPDINQDIKFIFD